MPGKAKLRWLEALFEDCVRQGAEVRYNRRRATYIIKYGRRHVAVHSTVGDRRWEQNLRTNVRSLGLEWLYDR